MNAYERQASNINSVKQRNAILRQQQWARGYDQAKRYEDQLFAYDRQKAQLMHDLVTHPSKYSDPSTIQTIMGQMDIEGKRAGLVKLMQNLRSQIPPQEYYDTTRDTGAVADPFMMQMLPDWGS